MRRFITRNMAAGTLSCSSRRAACARRWRCGGGRPGGPPRAWNDWTEVLPRAGYRVIAMDQRNAGKSKGAIAASHGWQTYAADQLALLDHLGITRCHTLGGCIGSSFCLMLSQTAPSRVSAQ